MPNDPATPTASNTIQYDAPAAPTVKPDGGVLGNAAMGALAGASENHNAPPIQTIQYDTAPSAIKYDNSDIPPVHTSLVDQASDWLDQHVLGNIPGVSDIHQGAKVVRDWADKKMGALPTAGTSPITAAAREFGLGVTRDIAGMTEGATSAKGLATIGAAVAAPVPVGLVLGGMGIHDFVQGWSDVHNLDDVMNPDKAQSLLNAAGQVVGGAAGVVEGTPGVIKAWERAKAGIRDSQYEAFHDAFRPSKGAPYDRSDWAAGNKRVMDEHMAGNPISDARTTEMAMNSAITKIENEVAQGIAIAPDTELQPDIFAQVRAKLQTSQKVGFYEDAMKSLEAYKGIGFERAGGVVDSPIRLRAADDLRHTMNADNQAFVGTLTKYDYANLMETNPAFAARNIAAEAIRNAEYKALEKLGMRNAAELRTTEGSIIKMRNAVRRQIYTDSDSAVAGTKPKAGAIRKTIGKVAPVAGAGLGAAAGVMTGIPGLPEAGAIGGGVVGKMVGDAVTGTAKTRGQLIQEAFTPPAPRSPLAESMVQGAAKTRAAISAAKTAGAGAPGAAAAGLITRAATPIPPDHIHVRASDGSEHYIPSDQLGNAAKIDPGLEILRSR